MKKYLTFSSVENQRPIQVEFVGCFKDNKIRALPRYILTGRSKNLPNTDFFGYINWQNLGDWIPEFAYACAKRTKDEKQTYFGLQFWG